MNLQLHKRVNELLNLHLINQKKSGIPIEFKAGDIVEIHTENEISVQGKSKKHTLNKTKSFSVIVGMILSIKGSLLNKSIKILTKCDNTLVVRIFSIYNSKVMSIKKIKSNNILRSKLLFLEKKLFDKNFYNIKINKKFRSLIQKF